MQLPLASIALSLTAALGAGVYAFSGAAPEHATDIVRPLTYAACGGFAVQVPCVLRAAIAKVGRWVGLGRLRGRNKP